MFTLLVAKIKHLKVKPVKIIYMASFIAKLVIINFCEFEIFAIEATEI